MQQTSSPPSPVFNILANTNDELAETIKTFSVAISLFVNLIYFDSFWCIVAINWYK